MEKSNRNKTFGFLKYDIEKPEKKLQKQYHLFYKEIFYDCIMVLYRINITTEKITKYDISHLSESILRKLDEIS